MWTWFANVFDSLLRGLEGLGALIAGLGAGMVTLITQAGTVLGLLVDILWHMALVAGSLVGGLLATLRSATSPAYSWGPAQGGADKLATAMGLDAVGWVLAGLVWMIIAVSVIRVVSRHD